MKVELEVTYSGQEIAACETGIGGAAWGLMKRKGEEDEKRERGGGRGAGRGSGRVRQAGRVVGQEKKG